MFFNFSLVLPVNELIFQWTISGSICVVLINANWNLFSNDGCWPHLIRRKRGHVFCAYSRHISQRLQAADRSSHLSKYEGGGKEEEEGDISVFAPFICCIPQDIRLFSKQKALFGVHWNSAPRRSIYSTSQFPKPADWSMEVRVTPDMTLPKESTGWFFLLLF